jgi:hypothetical protein
MSLQSFLNSSLIAASLCVAPLTAWAQAESTSCGPVSVACGTSCDRFKGDARFHQCEKSCRSTNSTGAESCSDPAGPACTKPCEAPNETATLGSGAAPSAPRELTRVLARKREVLRGRELNARMSKAMTEGDLPDIRELIEVEGVDPTYVYAFDFNPETRRYEGHVIRLRLTDIFNDTNELRGDAKSLDKILTLFIELGMDVTATLDMPAAAGANAPAAVQRARTAWGPSLRTMERAKDKDARFKAFEIALAKGLKPNEDVRKWLFEEFPQSCGRDRSQFAIQALDLLIEYLGTSLQDDLWRAGPRGPETLADALDGLLSPANPSLTEQTQFARMDEVWENCSVLSKRVTRYLIDGK